MIKILQYFTLIYESILSAIYSILANKLRSFLSILGITIGIFLVILVFTIVDSLENNIKKSVQSLGKNVIYVDKWEWSGGGSDYPWWKYLSRPDASLAELKALKQHPINNYFSAISYTNSSKENVRYESKKLENVEINGYTNDFEKIEELTFANGRFFNEYEDNFGSPVAVIGANIAKGLFANENDALGKNIYIFGKQITIIGVFKFQGDNLINIDFDDKIVVPIQFLEYAISKKSGGKLIIKLKDDINEAAVFEEIRGTMRSIRRISPTQDDNFSLNKISMLTDSIGVFFKSVNSFGLIIGLFALLVGGFGVANIMFVSVKERTHLIGIQKALGAKKLFILIQFLTESVILSIIGGVVGLLFTSGLSTLVNWGLKKFTESSFELELSWHNIFIGLLFSCLIGLLAGFIPAYQASEMQPVEAMRSK